MAHALDSGVMRTMFGWDACIIGHRNGIEVHDAVLIEAPIGRIDADAALMGNHAECVAHRARRAGGWPERAAHGREDRAVRGAQIWQQILDLLSEHERQQEEDERRRGR